MILNPRIPGAIDCDVMKLMHIIILQIEIYQVFYGSTLYGRNGEHATG